MDQRPSIRQLLKQALDEHQAGRTARAKSLYQQVLAIDADNADALHLLGVLIGAGDPAGALGLIRRALQARPKTAIFHNSLGTILAAMGDSTASLEAFAQAIALDPRYAEAHANLGTAFAQAGRLEEAEAMQRTAISLNPKYAEGHSHLGDTLRRQGRLDEAIAAQRQAIILNPRLAVAHNNLGVALREAGSLDHALSAFERAIELQPAYTGAHYNLAMALLAIGEYPRGWAEYHWRWKLSEFRSRRRDLSQPCWDGGDIAGKTILLHAEQGFGDTLQMIRFAAAVAARGARVVVECQPELRRLLATAPGVDQVIERGGSLPPFDVHLSLMDLPRILGTRLETIPSRVPYLVADQTAVPAVLADRSFSTRSLLVGIAWAGNAHPDPLRICPAHLLRPLARMPGVQLVSLQKPAPTEEERSDLSLREPPLNDFYDTAAVIANLDLVISVDTAVAHLAGAMGAPTWTLLPFAADWRWLTNRDDSPWYPTMRLFRQRRRGDWAGVVEDVCVALKHEVESSPAMKRVL